MSSGNPTRKRPREDTTEPAQNGAERPEARTLSEGVVEATPAPVASSLASASAAAAAERQRKVQKGLALPTRKPATATGDGSKPTASGDEGSNSKPQAAVGKGTSSATIEDDGTVVERKSKKYLDDNAFQEVDAEALGQSGGPMFGKGYKGGVDSSAQDRNRQDYAAALQSRLADDDDF
jgi:hypothetical protein